MRQLLFISLLIVVTATNGLAQKKQLEIKNEPKLFLPDGYEVDLGEVAYSDTVQVRVRVQNKGKGDLVFEKVRATCSCTQISLPDRPIPPGGESHIKLQYIASQDIFKGLSQLRLYYNSMKSPAFLDLKATIKME